MSTDTTRTPHLLRYHLLGVLCWLYPVGYPRICNFNLNTKYRICVILLQYLQSQSLPPQEAICIWPPFFQSIGISSSCAKKQVGQCACALRSRCCDGAAQTSSVALILRVASQRDALNEEPASFSPVLFKFQWSWPKVLGHPLAP